MHLDTRLYSVRSVLEILPLTKHLRIPKRACVQCVHTLLSWRRARVQHANILVSADDPNSPVVRKYVDDTFQRSTKLTGLEPDREYILYIWARTNEGAGDQDFLEDKTLAIGRESA